MENQDSKNKCFKFQVRISSDELSQMIQDYLPIRHTLEECVSDALDEQENKQIVISKLQEAGYFRPAQELLEKIYFELEKMAKDQRTESTIEGKEYSVEVVMDYPSSEILKNLGRLK